MGNDVENPRSESADLIGRLPHAAPFRFVSEILELGNGEAGSRSQGVWRVRGDEPFFAWHFPGHPLVPGVLIGEALAQLSGLGWGAKAGAAVRLARIDLKVHGSVSPPAEIELVSVVARAGDELAMFVVEATVGGRKVASGWITLARGGKEGES